MSGKQYELIAKSCDMLMQTLTSIKQLTEQYAKQAQNQKKIKENRERPPKVHYENEMPRKEDLFRQGVKPNNLVTKPILNNERENHGAEKPAKIDEAGKMSDKNTIKPAIEKYASKLTERAAEKDNQGRKSSRDKREEAQQQKVKAQDKTEAKNKQKPGKIKPAPVGRPKIVASSYLRFSKDMMSMVKKEQPNLTQTDIMAVLGHMWNNLEQDKKKFYDEAYRRDKEKYDAQMTEYYRKYPEQKPKRQLNQERREQRQK